MAENGMADVLRKLATGTANRPDTARLRDIFDEVEAALSAGVTHAAIHEALQTGGFKLTLKSFQSALYRLREERQKGSRKREAQPAQPSTPNQVRRATPTTGVSPASPPAPPPVGKKRGPLELAPSPKKWEWDPLERPVFEFIDEVKPKDDDEKKP